MLFVKFLSALFFITTLKRCESVLDAKKQIKLIEENTTIHYSSRLSNTIKISDGDATSECEICMRNIAGIHREQYNNKYKLYAFNVFINSKFANWTLNQIYKLLKFSPIFYQYRFQTFAHYDAVFKEPLENNIRDLMSDISEYVEHFVNVLTVLKDLTPNDLYYADEHVLKTLLSLKIKMHYIPSIQEETNEANGTSDFKIVQLLLMDMIELQTYLSTHCPETPASKKTSQLYGYWVAIDHELTNEDITLVMRIVNEKFRFKKLVENENSSCTLPTIFDPRHLGEPKDGPIVFIINRAEVKVSLNKRTPLKKFWEEIMISYDVDVVFEYQDSIINSLFNLIYILLMELRDDLELKEETVQKLKVTKLKVDEYKDRLPKCLVDGFLTFVVFINTGLHTNENYSNDLLDKVTFENYSYDGINIDDLFDIVVENIKDFICFDRYFASVRREHGKLYSPWLENKLVSIAADENDATTLSDGCDFVRNVYALSYKALLHLNWYSDSVEYSTKEKHYDWFLETCDDIFNYCFVAFENVSHIVVRKIALDAAIIVSNTPIQYVSDSNPPNIRRSFQVIMNKMDGYAIKNCTARSSTFLLFRNLDVTELGEIQAVDESMTKFFAKHIHDFSDRAFVDVRSRGDRLLNLKTFHETHVKDNEVIEAFQDRIKVNWKGSVQNFADIVFYEEHYLLNPHHLYALYDVYFVYHAAVIFVHIKNAMSKSQKLKLISQGFWNIRQELIPDGDWCKLFPRQLKSLVQDLDNTLKYLRRVYRTTLTDKEKMLNLKKRIFEIKNKFDGFGIVFKENNFFSSSVDMIKTSVSLKNSKEKKVLPQFIEILEPVLKNYSVLHFDTISVPEVHDDNTNINHHRKHDDPLPEENLPNEL